MRLFSVVKFIFMAAVLTTALTGCYDPGEKWDTQLTDLFKDSDSGASGWHLTQKQIDYGNDGSIDQLIKYTSNTDGTLAHVGK